MALHRLTTEARNPASADLDRMGAAEIVALMNDEDRRCAEAVASQRQPIADAIEAIATSLRQGGRLIYLGAGTSGRLGILDAVECPPTFCSPPTQILGLIAGGERAFIRAVEGAEDDPALGARDLAALDLADRDTVVGIAASGRTPYVLGAVAEARRRGALTIGVSCTHDSELAAAVDIAITPVVGPEILTGSTRLKAGTATKMVLNMLSTGAMVRLGKTYGNLMVDVQATNDKLRQRARRIVAQVTGLDDDAAGELLRRCDGEVKTAIVSQRLGLEPSVARQRLAESNGIVRRALGEAE